MLAAWYYLPGLQKMRIDWLAHDQLAFLMAAATDNGWLSGLSEPGLQRLLGIVETLNPVLLLLTLTVELGAVTVLLFRRSAVFFCLGWAALHLGIFVASGIFFWKWNVLDLALLVVLGRVDLHPENRRSRAVILLISVVLIHAAGIWQPTPLAWYDTPVSAVYRMTAIGESGMRYEVAPSYLAPYDLTFAQGRFRYLDEIRPLVFTYGTTQELRHLRAAKLGPAEIEKNRTIRPLSAEELAQRERYDRLIREFFRHLNAHLATRGERPRPWSRLEPPMHIWTFPTSRQPYREQEPVVRIEVGLEESFFDGSVRQVFAEHLVHEVGIPPKGLAP